MPIIISYVLLAILVAPAMVKLGVPPMGAHMFIFCFALLADLTPPVAMEPFIAAGIAGGSPMATAWIACRIGLVLYILPFMIAYNPVLMLEGPWLEILQSIATAAIGIVSLASFIQRHLFRRNTLLESLLLGVASVALIHPGWTTDLIGLAMFFTVVLIQRPRFFLDLLKVGNNEKAVEKPTA